MTSRILVGIYGIIFALGNVRSREYRSLFYVEIETDFVTQIFRVITIYSLLSLPSRLLLLARVPPREGFAFSTPTLRPPGSVLTRAVADPEHRLHK